MFEYPRICEGDPEAESGCVVETVRKRVAEESPTSVNVVQSKPSIEKSQPGHISGMRVGVACSTAFFVILRDP